MIVERSLDRLSMEARQESRNSLHEDSDHFSLAQDWDTLSDNPHLDGYHDAFEMEDHHQRQQVDDCVWVESCPTMKKGVRFPLQPVQAVVLLEDHSKADAQDIWYSSQEFEKSTRDLQVIVQEARQQNKLAVEGTDHLRGLEDIASPKAHLQRKQRMTQVVKAVLEEQSRQQVRRISDPLELSLRSIQVSQDALTLARRRAQGDATTAQSFLRS